MVLFVISFAIFYVTAAKKVEVRYAEPSCCLNVTCIASEVQCAMYHCLWSCNCTLNDLLLCDSFKNII